MNPRSHRTNSYGWCVAALAASAVFVVPMASAASADTRGAPIVMEQATVRGKIALLETRREDRQVATNITITVWSTREKTTASRRKSSRLAERLERDALIHKTLTDEEGLFSLPEIGVGNYFLGVESAQFVLTVVPRDPVRAAQEEPKILLILIPRDVLRP